uniref:lipopolysaccharide heptosyltransferase II n=1 Tax=Eiseniibacteriota bacterium TaxID=2212470 RepID=A0A832MJH1_UNCEI
MARLLVRLPNWLGDALLARTMLHAVRRASPRLEVLAVGPGPLLGLLAADGLFDAVEAWPAGGAARAALARAVRAWGPDAALVLPPSFSSAWFARRCGARRRAGFAHEGRSLLLTHPLRRRARGDVHLAREYAALAACLGLGPADPPPPPPLAVPAPGAAEAEALLARVAPGDGPLALIGPGALYGPAKRWAPERFAAVGRALAGRGMRVVVCGAAAERETCRAVAEAADCPTLAGETSLAAQAALCARAALAVCNDSGLAHLAAAAGAPTVAVFGSTSSAWTAPLGARVRVVQRPPVCAPCFRRTCAIGTRCLERVAVADVLRACAEAAA